MIITFSVLLILVSQRVEEQVKEFVWGHEGSVFASEDEPPLRKKQRGNAPQYLEYFVAIYVLGNSLCCRSKQGTSFS